MQLDQLQARLRPRTPWEAIDLGFAMFRRWWRPTMAAWAVMVLPALGMLSLVAIWSPLLAAFLIWWLKPLWDRPVLFVLSRALFGATPQPRAVWGEKLWRHDLFGAVVWRRLDLARSFVAPIRSLEQLSGGLARQRRRDLTARGAGVPAVSLTFACWWMEMFVAMGLVGLVLYFLPDTPRYGAWTLLSQLFNGAAPGWFNLLLLFAYIGAVSLVEPLYVAGGFGLYVNRRTLLEGWDIELTFRQLAERLQEGKVLLLAVFACLAVAALSTQAQAQPVQDASPQETIDEILARPEFGAPQTTTRYQIKEWVLEWFTWEQKENYNFGFLAEGMRFALLVLLGVMIVGVVILIVTQVRPGLVNVKAAWRPALPERISGGLPAPPEALPRDVVSKARALWEKGDREAALSLLYRGALAWMIDHRQAEIEEGDTEADCLRAARAVLGTAQLAYFQSLTRSWIQIAYGRRTPDEAVGAALLEDWGTHFGVAS